MTRRIAAVVFILVLTPALLYAQDVLTVGVLSAPVHKGPSTGTPIVGLAPRGTVLPVTNNLGSWIKVAWPEAPDGVGYVHVTMGKIDLPGARPTTTSTTNASPRLSPAAATTGAVTMPPAGAATIPPAPLPSRPLPSEPSARRGGVSRVVGIGGLVGSPRSVGATARVWGNKHLGIQFGFTRETMTSDVAAGRVTSMQFEPGVMFVPLDRVTDYVWFRPYVGSVVSLRRQTLRVGAPEGPHASDSAVGLRVFGGSELRFSSLPQFAVSVELGYRRFPAQFAGFEADPVTASIAGHWYIK